MSYKQFIQELEDDILPAEAERRYVLESTMSAMCINIQYNEGIMDYVLTNDTCNLLY